jgi:hypothetical protein
LVFLDESGMNLSMSRSHAWVKRGEELIDRGAIRMTGWVVLTSMFATANKDRFVAWMKRKLLPKLRRGCDRDGQLESPPRRARWTGVRGSSASSTCRLSRRTSTRSNLAGPCRNSTSAASHRDTQTHFVEWHVAPGTASRNGIVGSGLLTAVTQFNPTDLWG